MILLEKPLRNIMKKGFGIVKYKKSFVRYAQELIYFSIREGSLFLETARLNSDSKIIVKKTIRETLDVLKKTNPEALGFITIRLDVLNPSLLTQLVAEDLGNFQKAIYKKYGRATFSICFEADSSLDKAILKIIAKGMIAFY